MNGRGVFLSLALGSLVIGGAACSSSGGTGVTTPTPTPSGSAGVTLGSLGNVSCTAPDNAVPGTYVSIDTQGTVTGNTYTQDSDGAGSGWNTNAATAAVSTPAPTSAPVVFPSVPPSTSGAVVWIVYYGEYSVPFTSALTTGVSNGCFVMPTQAMSTGSNPTSFLAVGQGLTTFAPPYPTETDAIAQGPMDSFSITNLSRTTGTGSFVMNTAILGNVLTVSGTLNITGSTAFYYNENLEIGSIKRRVMSRLR